MFILFSYLIGLFLPDHGWQYCALASTFSFSLFAILGCVSYVNSLRQLSKDLIHGTVKIGFSVLKSCHILGMRSGDQPWRIEFEYQLAATRYSSFAPLLSLSFEAVNYIWDRRTGFRSPSVCRHRRGNIQCSASPSLYMISPCMRYTRYQHANPSSSFVKQAHCFDCQHRKEGLDSASQTMPGGRGMTITQKRRRKAPRVRV